MFDTTTMDAARRRGERLDVWRERVSMLTMKAAFAALLAWFFGLPAAYLALVGMVVLDAISAFVANWKHQMLSLRKFKAGIPGKLMFFVLIAACELLAAAVRHSTGAMDPIPAGKAVALLLCGHEFLSVLRNLKRADVWMPKSLVKAGRQLEEHLGEEENDAEKKS